MCLCHPHVTHVWFIIQPGCILIKQKTDSLEKAGGSAHVCNSLKVSPRSYHKTIKISRQNGEGARLPLFAFVVFFPCCLLIGHCWSSWRTLHGVTTGQGGRLDAVWRHAKPSDMLTGGDSYEAVEWLGNYLFGQTTINLVVDSEWCLVFPELRVC